MKIDRSFPNIQSSDITKTKKVFCELLDLKVEYESDWFIHLKSESSPCLELGILPVSSNIIPKDFQKTCCGTLLTYTVEDADAFFLRAKEIDLKVIEEPTNQFYGQRRLLLLEECSGVLIDLSSECEPSKDFMNSF